MSANFSTSSKYSFQVAYIEGFETLDDRSSLINELILTKNRDSMISIVNYFWAIKKKNESLTGKIKPLWNMIYNQLSDSEDNPEYQDVFSELSKWISLVDKLDDDIVQWLLTSAKYIDKQPNYGIFIDELHKHLKSNPKVVGLIYLEALQGNNFPYYKDEIIYNIVEELYNNNQKDIANQICNKHGEVGQYFLQSLYYKYNDMG